MDSKLQELMDSKMEFRKPSSDSSNRKYRRRSSVSGSSSSSDGSQQDRSSSPFPSRKNIAKDDDDKWKKDDGRELDMEHGRSNSSRSREAYKHPDRQSSRSYHRHDDHSRRDKHSDDYDRAYSKSSYRSARDSQDSHSLHHSRRDREHYRSRDYPNDVDKYSRDKSDGSGHRSRDKDSSNRSGSGRRHANIEDRDRDRDKDRDRHSEVGGRKEGKKDHQRGYGDNRSNSSPTYEESKVQRNDSVSRSDSSGHRWKEASQRHVKEPDGGSSNEEKRRYDNQDSYKEKCCRESEEHSISDGTEVFSSKDQNPVAKKPKLLNFDSSNSGANGASEQAYVTDSDIDAAKIAAMKAAELVNRNLVGTGYMSADQKKKLLWGNKKSTNTEESAHRWDTANFGDRERQEKFNKLMGLKGDGKVENHPDNPDLEKQQEQLQLDLEKQYTAGLRRRDGRTVGLGL